TPVRFPPEIGGSADQPQDQQLMTGPIAVNSNDLYGQPANGRGKSGSRVRYDIDFPGHETGDSHLPRSDHQHLQLKPLVFEKAVLLTVVERGVADRKPCGHDDKFLGGDSVVSEKNETTRNDRCTDNC